MANQVFLKAGKLIKRWFYIFLDISGILLGVFLTALGLWIAFGRGVARGIGIAVFAIGIIAFLIHVGHYFHLKLVRWFFGSENYFITQDKDWKKKI